MLYPSRTGKLSIALLVVALAVAGWLTGVQAQAPEPGQLDLGARLYADNCAVCHGVDGMGRVGATLAKDWPSIRPDLRVRATIENGIEGSPMLGWSQVNGGPLTAQEIDALVAYILSWETGGPAPIPPTPTPHPRPFLTPLPEVEGDPNQGALLYDQNCLVCHGPNGEGRVGATLARVWPAIRADLQIEATISNGIQGSPMPAWGQVNGGPLTETEIKDLVAFILALPAISGGEIVPPAQPAPASWLSGWGGILLTVVLFILIVGVALAVQARRPG